MNHALTGYHLSLIWLFPLMFKHHLLAVGLALAVAMGLAGFIWWDATQQPLIISPQPHEPPLIHQDAPVLPSTSLAPRLESGYRAPSEGLFRCDGVGGTLYQAEPCPGDTRQSEVNRGTFSVVAPPVIVTAPHQAPMHSGQEQITAMQRASTTQRNQMLCDQHRKAILRIDSEGRAGGTGRKMERLREERRHHVEQMWKLRCESPF